MLKPRPLYPGPRPPYIDTMVRRLKDGLEDHLRDNLDPHNTKALIPIVSVVDSIPASLDEYKPTDVVIVRGSGDVYRVVAGPGGNTKALELAASPGDVRGFDGREFRLDDENDLYDAVDAIVRKLGGTVK